MSPYDEIKPTQVASFLPQELIPRVAPVTLVTGSTQFVPPACEP